MTPSLSRRSIVLTAAAAIAPAEPLVMGEYSDNEWKAIAVIEDGKIVEHWDVLQTIPPKDQQKNENGKF